MPAKFAWRYRFAIATFAAVFLIAVLIIVAYRTTVAALRASEWVTHTYEVIAALDRVVNTVVEDESAQRAYLISGDATFLREAVKRRDSIAHQLDVLEHLLADNPVQTADAAKLRGEVMDRVRFLDRGIALRRTGGAEAARKFIEAGEGRVAMEHVQSRIAQMRKREYDLLDRRRAAFQNRVQQTLTTIVIVTLFDLALIAAIFYLVQRDIRRGRSLSKALTASRDAAITASELRSQFLANMSHEIRTPMNAIVGMTGLLLDTSLDENQRELAETVRTSADSLLTIINDILDFSKIEAGKLVIEPTDFELRGTVEAIIDLFSESAHSKHLEIGLLVDHDLPAVVRGDPGRIRQVLTNLVSNAVKFTTEGGVIVTLNGQKQEGDDIELLFAVTDTGIGVNEETKQQLFTPFTQADASVTRRYGGTGLGLAISKQLVQLMGGHIGVESVEGKGSTFWFSLPVTRISDVPLPRSSESALTGLKVLIVDDSETHRRVVRHNLAAWRMQCFEAGSGTEALEKLRDAAAEGAPFDVALVDIVMPGMNGVVLSRLIKCETDIAEVKIIAVTSMANRLEPGVMRAIGISSCLTKPLKGSALYDAIASAMSGIETPSAAVIQPATALREHVRVLVAEDNPVNQKVAARQLQKLGISADTVANGLEALEAMSRIDYDAVFMDCQMPEMDGYAASREIRRREEGSSRHTPIIALTANALEGDRERCLAAGMDDYLAKPVRESELVEVIERWMPRRTEPPIAEEVLARLREIGNGDEFLREVAALFLTDTPPRLGEIAHAVERGEAEALRESAHALKSSCGNIGAMRLRHLAEQLERMGAADRMTTAESALKDLISEYARVEERLKELQGAPAR